MKKALDAPAEVWSFVVTGLALGWSESSGVTLTEETADHLIDDTWRVLSTVGVFTSDGSRHGVLGVTAEGQTFARAMLSV